MFELSGFLQFFGVGELSSFLSLALGKILLEIECLWICFLAIVLYFRYINFISWKCTHSSVCKYWMGWSGLAGANRNSTVSTAESEEIPTSLGRLGLFCSCRGCRFSPTCAETDRRQLGAQPACGSDLQHTAARRGQTGEACFNE